MDIVELESQLLADAKEKLFPLIDDSVSKSLDNAVKAAVSSAVAAAVGTAVNEAVHSAVNIAVHDVVGPSVQEKVDETVLAASSEKTDVTIDIADLKNDLKARNKLSSN